MPNFLRWARRILEWGADMFSWGNEPEAPPVSDLDFNSITHYTFEIDFPEGAVNYWTGDNDITLGGRRFSGIGNIVTVSGMGGQEGQAENRINLSFTVTDPSFKRQLLQDPGVVPVTISLAYSNDGGNTFLLHTRSFRGIASNHKFTGSIYSIDIVDETWNTERVNDEEWSHEGQQRRFPGDLAFQNLPAIATEGIQINFPG